MNEHRPKAPARWLSVAIGALVTLITSPIVFNLLPGTARAVAPLVCSGTFDIVESGRKRGHQYLCDVGGDVPDDVTNSATVLTVLLCFTVFFALVHGARIGLASRRSRR